MIIDFSVFQNSVALNQERLIDFSEECDTDYPPQSDEMNGIRIPENLESLVKELEIDKELMEIDTNTFNDKEFAGFAVTPERNVVKRVDNTERPKYCCHICGKQSLNEDDHEIHQFYHQLPEKSYETFLCEICSKTYHNHTDFMTHLKRHTIDPQTCQICDKEFENQIKLDGHLRNCHAPLINVCCETCGKICKNKRILNLHTHLTHKPKEEVKCKICNIKLSFHRGLERHNRTVHNPNVKKYECGSCDKKFMSRRALNVHERRHAEIEARKHKCDFCDERFHEIEDHQAHRIKEHPLEYTLMRQERFTINQEMENGQTIKITLV